MNTPRALLSIIFLMLCSLTANAQRQTKLYIDDGHGHFTILQSTGGDTVTFPGTSGTLLASTGNIVISTETDTAKSANTVTVSGNTASATVVKNGSTGGVNATVTNGASGQVLYLFNDLGDGNTVTLSTYAIADGKIGIFIYLAAAWRPLANPPATIITY